MRKGFTLVELLISISIVAIMTAMVVVNIGGGSRKQELRLAADNLASVIRKAQISSSAGRQVNSAVPVGGYGVSLPACTTPPCSVYFFADLDGGLDYDGAAELQETVKLPSTIEIPTVPGGNMTLLFKPPQGVICLNVNCDQAGTADVTLRSKIDLSTVLLKVSRVSGQITIQ